MLIRFAVQNFLSFEEKMEFSMVPGKVKKHPLHIVSGDHRHDIDILASSVIYGANASGKSNFVKAIQFAQQLIIYGTRPHRNIPVTFFKLNSECATKPSHFSFEIRSKDDYYAYGFELDQHKIHSEWLYAISKKSNRCIFERSSIEEKTHVTFGNGMKFTDHEEKKFIEFTAKGTRINQLFLTECEERGVSHFHNIYSWFENVLTIIKPDTIFHGLELHIDTDQKLKNSFVRFLCNLDTGISGLDLIKIEIENEPSIPKHFHDTLLEKLSDESEVLLYNTSNHLRFMLRANEHREIQAYKLITKHKAIHEKKDVSFEIAEESDGTQRLMDLIPALLELLNNDRVFVIDEINRSLHPNLTYKLIELFLEHRKNRLSQLILTTHESCLLDLALFRRDEIWFLEKTKSGASTAYSLEEYTPRYDKDIRKGYLLGRFGAIPIMHDITDLGWQE